MTIKPENSSECFKRLLAESKSPKFHKSLEYIRKACDAIVSMQGLLNKSQIGTYTEEHFGTPKKSSIFKSKNLGLYINIREHEYAAANPKLPKSQQHSKETPYPAPDLDLKTKVYIDHLRSKVKQLEHSMSYINEKVLEKTSKQPINFIQSISQGPDEDLSMELSSINHDKKVVFSDISILQKPISKLLALAFNPNLPLEIREKNGKRILVLETKTVTETLLFEDELSSLEAFICRS